MRDTRELVRSENAGSGLAFRASVPVEDEDDSLIRDILSLANADWTGPRLLVLGVDDTIPGKRKIPGVDRAELIALKRRLARLAAEHIEPALELSLGAAEIDDRLVAVVRIGRCTEPPYLVKAGLGARLPAGIGFVRRGTRTVPLRRAELERMFTRGRPPAKPDFAVRVGFGGQALLEETTLAVLPVGQLPSELAAERLRTMLEAKEASREALGRTETRFSRLVHTRIYGAETPFEAHTDESLRQRLEHTVDDYGDADAFHQFEVRAHKLQLAVRNEGARELSDARLRFRLQRMEGIGVAERLYREDADQTATGSYPAVTADSNAIRFESRLGRLVPERKIDAFSEPPRLWIREPAAGKTLVLDYELEAREIDTPLRDSLLIHIVPA